MCVGVLKGSHSNHRVLGTIGGARVSMDHAVAFQRDSFPSGQTPVPSSLEEASMCTDVLCTIPDQWEGLCCGSPGHSKHQLPTDSKVKVLSSDLVWFL